MIDFITGWLIGFENVPYHHSFAAKSIVMSSIRSRPVMLIVACVLNFLFVITAFYRGNHLLGVSAGIIYSIVALMIIWLLVRTMMESPVHKLRVVFFILFSIPVCIAFAFPAFINTDFQYSIDMQAHDRAAREELQVVFSQDQAFTDLSVSTVHRKTVCVEIHGSIPKKDDLERVQSLVFARCGFVDHCLVRWRIFVHEDSIFYVSSKQDPFEPEAN